MDPQLIQRAVTLHQAGRLSEAADAFRDVLRVDPTHFGALYSLGVLASQFKNFEEAQTILARALTIDPRSVNAWFARARALAALNRPEESLSCLDRALALEPNFAEAMESRMVLLVQAQRPIEALAAARQLVALRPNNAADWNSLGMLYSSMRRLDEALASFERALAVKPDFMDALVNRATILLEFKRDDAIAAFDAAIAVNPHHAVAWNNRGNAFLRLERFEEALMNYGRALSFQPDLEQAKTNRDIALLALGRATRCPSLFVRRTFDDVAAVFETTMANLSYRAHLDLRLLAAGLLPPDAKKLRVLDLGSGTGLSGDVFKDLAAGGRLDGIDISPLMIEEAKKRGIYNRLMLGDIETLLAEPMPPYHLVVAADTMIYMGDLALSFSGAFRVLTPEGLFLFSVERKDGEGWHQTEAKRFRHSESYLREEGARAGFVFADSMECTLRYEAGQPVPGLALGFRKPKEIR
jgi:predicted TPR repeat methyltransferase